MTATSKQAEKINLHPRNKHRGQYDFKQLAITNTELAQFVRPNAYGDDSIDFANPLAVKTLNQALLQQFYAITHWDIPTQYLCPPIPGRADYLHYLADLLNSANNSVTPYGNNIRVLDIGVGANAIYPLIGQREYGWHFVGADIDLTAITNAQQILDANTGLAEAIELRLQTSASAIFKGIIQQDETFDLTMCNPPFHASLHDALAGTQRKWQNLAINQTKSSSKSRSKDKIKNETSVLNFGGQAAELYCAGGEEAFVNRMINESVLFKHQCLWFTTLISKATTLASVYHALKQVNALTVKTIDMAQGQKKSRMVAWTFLNTRQQHDWHNR
ncbi:MAG: 23S rRNA (adenine(1618)-N(6))-methyltransferase RlmF [Pseudomonadota bacterium]